MSLPIAASFSHVYPVVLMREYKRLGQYNSNSAVIKLLTLESPTTFPIVAKSLISVLRFRLKTV